MEANKSKSHYGPYSSQPNLNEFIEKNGIYTSYNEGYFLHLMTDYLFYRKFLKSWSSNIYEDYDKLNARIIQRYKIEIPREIKEIVMFRDGQPSLLREEEVYKFIDFTGKINVREIVLQKGNLQDKIKIEKGKYFR